MRELTFTLIPTTGEIEIWNGLAAVEAAEAKYSTACLQDGYGLCCRWW